MQPTACSEYGCADTCLAYECAGMCKVNAVDLKSFTFWGNVWVGPCLSLAMVDVLHLPELRGGQTEGQQSSQGHLHDDDDEKKGTSADPWVP